MTSVYSDLTKTLAVPSGATYSYIYKPAHASKPTILFLHGFPCTSWDWHHQIEFFSKKGYGLVVPDLLGYGGSSKPDSAQEYSMTRIATDVIAILDHENIEKVHSVGHDTGSIFQSRMVPYYHSRFLSLAFLAVPYAPPSGSHDIDIDAVNKISKEIFGYEVLGYWKFFEREDASEIIRDHIDSFLSLSYAEDPIFWKEHLAPVGALEKWLKSDQTAPIAKWMAPEDLKLHRQTFQDNYEAPLNWYKSWMQNVNKEQLEADVASGLDHKLHCPVLFVNATLEAINIPGGAETTRPLIENLSVREIISSHWLQHEKPDELNKVLEEHFTSTLPKCR